MAEKGWDSDAERALLADACRNSFWNFARFAYGISNNPRGGWLTPRVHKPLCDWFEFHVKDWMSQRRTTKIEKHLMILIPREFGKTTLITNAGLLWMQLLDPELCTYIGSENKEMAAQFLGPIKSSISGEDPYQKFTWLYGNWFNKDRDWRAEYLVHGARKNIAIKDPSFGIWGVATGLTGKHPDVICLDDPISYERLESDTGWLQTVNEHVDSLIPVLQGNGLQIIIGTRYADGDHFGSLLRTLGCRSLTGMPYSEAEPRPDGVFDVYFLSSRDIHRKPVLPEVWSDSRLRKFEKRNSLKYYAQQENDPHSGSHVALTRRHIEQLWVEPKDIPKNLRISVHCDTAFKYRERTARGDSSVICIWGHSRDGSGEVYFLGAHGSNTWRVEQFNDKLIMILQDLRKRGRWPFKLTDEQEPGGKAGTWEMTIQSWCHSAGLPAPPLLLINRGSTRKISRLMNAASFWIDRKVRLVSDAPGAEALIDQMLKIGTSEHDDYADAASDVFYKDVYVPARLDYENATNEPIRPYDEFLQPGRITLAAERARIEERRWMPMPAIE